MAERYGLELFLKSNVGPLLSGAASAAQGARAAVNTVGTTAASSFKVAGAAVVVFNQGLKLAKKGLDVFKATIGESLRSAMEFREVGDEMTKTFEGYNREVALTKARLGDALMPVIKGFTEAIGETTGRMSDLIEANQKLIGTTLIDWIGSAAKLLVGGLARSAEFVGNVFLGWKAIIGVVQVAVNGFFALVTDQLGFFAGAIAKAAEAFGASGLAKTVRQAQASVNGLGDEFRRSSDEAGKGVQKTSSEIGKLERTLDKLQAKANQAIGQGMVRAQKEVAKATVGTTKTIEEQTAALDKLNEARKKGAESKPSDSKSVGIGNTTAVVESSDAGAQIGGAVTGAMGGAAGQIAGGFATGGLMGGATAAVGAALQESKGFQKAIGVLNDIFSQIVQAIEPLMPLLVMLANLLEAALGPQIKIVGEVLKRVSLIIIWVFEAIAKVWNGIVGAITGILKKIGGFEVFGKKPFGKLEEWGRSIDRKAKISMDGFDRARRAVSEGYDDTAEEMKGGAEVLSGTVDEMNRQLTNVPRILKVALREFEAADPDGPMGSLTASSSAPDGGQGNASNGGNTILVETVQVTQALDPDEVATKVHEDAIRLGIATKGALPGGTMGVLSPTVATHNPSAGGLNLLYKSMAAGLF